MDIKPFSFRSLGGNGGSPDLVSFNASMADNTDSPLAEENAVFRFEDIKKAENDGYRKGYEAGLSEGKSATLEIDTKLNQTLSVVADQMDELRKSYENIIMEHKDILIRSSIDIANKITLDVIPDNMMKTIESMADQILEIIIPEPKIEIEVHSSMHETLGNSISKHLKEKGYEGQINVVAGDMIAPDDCVIKWSDGGIKRDKEAVWNDIEKLFGCERMTVNPPVKPDITKKPDSEKENMKKSSDNEDGVAAHAEEGGDHKDDGNEDSE